MGKVSRFGLLASLLVVGALLVAAYPAAVLAYTHPIACYGDVELDGAPAPVDTVIAIYIGADTTPSATFEVETAGEYRMDVWADTSRHDQTLSYRVNGVPAKKLGPDPGVFGWEVQQVDLEADGGPHILTFSASGFFPKHLPDAYTGQVILADLYSADPDADIWDQVQGVWWFDGPALEWKFWVPGVGGDLTTLNGQFHDYMVLVSGACAWEIPLP